MTELAVRDTEETVGGLNDLVQWANEARAAASIAHSLARTPFVPASLRANGENAFDVTVANVTAAILTGRELGIHPMASLRSIDVIQGTPAMRAVAMRALVQAAGHDVWVDEQSDTKAVVCGQRAGSDRVQKSTWTIQRANQLGLTSKANWKNQPSAMLVARATSEVCRLIASDVLLGLAYSAEELEADQPAETAEQPRRRTARRKPVELVQVEEPPLEPPADDGPADAEPVEDWPEVAPIPGVEP